MDCTSTILSFFIFAVIIVQRQHFTESADIRIPPALTNQPPAEIQYKTKSDIILPCTASGSAPLQYSWKKNGSDLDWNAPRISRPNPAEGSITINEAIETDAGDYQCYVWNDYGKAATTKTKLVCGQLDDFSGGVVVTDHAPKEFESFQLPCNPPRSIPNVTYYWTIGDGGTTTAIVSPDARKQIDSNGNLHFANVKLDDSQSGKKYTCMAKNELADKIFGGSYARINVQSGVKPTQPPSVLFRSPATVIGLEGQSVLLRCFFSGYPDPKIEWKRQSGSLPYPRFTTTMFNSGASITGLVPTDEGVYMCTGTVDSQSVTEYINLTVQAVPRLTETPADVNASVGDDVTIRCQAYAKPPATIKWYKNTDELTTMPPKFTLSPDRTTLTVSNVQKSYDDSTGQTVWDLMVIQCTASNTHGRVLGQGYLNVLERTVIVNRSSDVTDVAFQPYETVTFDCYATTDDSTTVTYNWYFNDNTTPIIYDNKTYYFTGNRLYIVTQSDADGGAARAGKYTCEATNSYSTDRVEFLLTTVGAFPVTSSASMIIGIVVGIVLFILLILLLVLLFFYIQRNKGDEYPVDEKERITGNDPEQELLDSGFHDYQRPASATGGAANMNTMQKATYSSAPPTNESLTESMPRIGSDEDPSLSAYGNPLDYGKFREDGSFIGQYNVNTGYRK